MTNKYSFSIKALMKNNHPGQDQFDADGDGGVRSTMADGVERCLSTGLDEDEEAELNEE